MGEGSANASRRPSVQDLGPPPPKIKKPKKALIQSNLTTQALDFTESKVYSILMIIATLFALFGVDIYMLSGPPKTMDEGLYVVVFIVFFLFIGEWTLFSVSKPGYFLSFFFCLDFLAWLSLVPDVLLLFGVVFFDAGGSITIARAGRAARAGTRAARIVRVVKLLAVMKKERQRKQTLTEVEEELEEAQRPSKVGTKLSDLVTMKVIVIVGMMLIVSSLLDLIEGNDQATFQQYLEKMENAWLIMGPSFPTTNRTNNMMYSEYFAKFIVDLNSRGSSNDYSTLKSNLQADLASHHDCVGCPGWPTTTNWLPENEACQEYSLLYVKLIDTVVWCSPQSYEHLRSSPSEFIMTQTTSGSELVLDDRSYSKAQALVNVVQVSFVILLLLVASALFTRDAEIFIIGPLDKMAELVKKLSKNPLAHIAEDDDESEKYETDFVESALKKFGKLLQIAFGEAGAEIIARNLAQGNDDLDPMVAGKKMEAIFGFCDIRNFTDCTECLQEDVMVFVNRIAHYVHTAVKENWGAANKNIGDAFLLVWRLPEPGAPPVLRRQMDKVEDEPHQPEEAVDPSTVVFDKALESFVRIIMETSACPELRQMTDNPKIQERIPGYRVRMGFGLHAGWAIEGAIGSTLKIDASYLSPHVNMAARLEAATKQFRTSILMSGPFFKHLSAPVQTLCRRIDRVTVKGSIEPIEFFTYDVAPTDATSLDEVEIDPDYNFFEQFAPATTAAYRREFASAVDLYIAGQWADAYRALEACVAQWSQDGPAEALMGVLEESGRQAPANWPGFRELVEK